MTKSEVKFTRKQDLKKSGYSGNLIFREKGVYIDSKLNNSLKITDIINNVG